MIALKESKGFAWALMALALAVPFVAWNQSIGPNPKINLYTLFPLLGLWAWSIMWTHYVYGTLTLVSKTFQRNQAYKKVSGWVVFVLILLHPGLLAWAQWDSLEKLPPGSLINYVAASEKFYLMIASIALICFLAYEVLERLRDDPFVAKIWRWVSLSQMLAMTFIFLHALVLGRHLADGWFKVYWIILGIILIPCFIIVGRADWKSPAGQLQNKNN